MKNNFSKNLLNLLTEKNLSQKELSVATNIDETVISHWLTGKTEPAIKSVNKLAKFFGVPVSYFYTGNITEKSSSSDSLKDKEISILKHEIEVLKNEIEFLNKKNNELEKEILKLKESKK